MTRPLLTGLCALAFLVTPLLGGFYAVRGVIAHVPGVDALGNVSDTLGADAPGKSYKNIRTGIIVQINRAHVGNLLLRPKHFKNLGLPIVDPQLNVNLTTTSDLLVVGLRRVNGLIQDLDDPWQAVQICVFDPRFPVLETDE
jgi:hypothetical protein